MASDPGTELPFHTAMKTSYPRPPVRSTRGFTLIETMLVLVLIGLMTGLAAPRLEKFVIRTHVQGAADELVTAIAHSRILATRQGQSVTLSITDATPYPYVATDASGRVLKRGTLRTGDRPLTLTAASFVFGFDRRGLKAAGPSQVTFSSGDVATRVTITELGKAFREN